MDDPKQAIEQLRLAVSTTAEALLNKRLSLRDKFRVVPVSFLLVRYVLKK